MLGSPLWYRVGPWPAILGWTRKGVAGIAGRKSFERERRVHNSGPKTLHAKHPDGREVALQTREVFDVARVYDSAAA